jgi:DegV family protein with EDD domain
MSAVRVVTDSACDLTDAVLAELDVVLVPLFIRFGEVELVDRVQLSTKEFWARSAAMDQLPETAAPAPGAFVEAFLRAKREGADGVVCVNLSSRLSATIESARSAAREVADVIPVRVVDSLNVTVGEGLVVQVAARLARSGLSLEEVADQVGAIVPKVKVFGVLDTLENLKKGGRIGGAKAIIGSMLSIKPVIEIVDGEVKEESKPRTRRRSLQYLAEKVLSAGTIEELAVAGADTVDIDEFVRLISAVKTNRPMMQGDIGPVIGTHAGPGAIAAAWLPAD